MAVETIDIAKQPLKTTEFLDTMNNVADKLAPFSLDDQNFIENLFENDINKISFMADIFNDDLKEAQWANYRETVSEYWKKEESVIWKIIQKMDINAYVAKSDKSGAAAKYHELLADEIFSNKTTLLSDIISTPSDYPNMFEQIPWYTATKWSKGSNEEVQWALTNGIKTFTKDAVLTLSTSEEIEISKAIWPPQKTDATEDKEEVKGEEKTKTEDNYTPHSIAEAKIYIIKAIEEREYDKLIPLTQIKDPAYEDIVHKTSSVLCIKKYDDVLNTRPYQAQQTGDFMVNVSIESDTFLSSVKDYLTYYQKRDKDNTESANFLDKQTDSMYGKLQWYFSREWNWFLSNVDTPIHIDKNMSESEIETIKKEKMKNWNNAIKALTYLKKIEKNKKIISTTWDTEISAFLGKIDSKKIKTVDDIWGLSFQLSIAKDLANNISDRKKEELNKKIEDIIWKVSLLSQTMPLEDQVMSYAALDELFDEKKTWRNEEEEYYDKNEQWSVKSQFKAIAEEAKWLYECDFSKDEKVKELADKIKENFELLKWNITEEAINKFNDFMKTEIEKSETEFKRMWKTIWEHIQEKERQKQKEKEEKQGSTMKLRKQSIIAQMGTTGDYSLLEKIDPDNTLIPSKNDKYISAFKENAYDRLYIKYFSPNNRNNYEKVYEQIKKNPMITSYEWISIHDLTLDEYINIQFMKERNMISSTWEKLWWNIIEPPDQNTIVNILYTNSLVVSSNDINDFLLYSQKQFQEKIPYYLDQRAYLINIMRYVYQKVSSEEIDEITKKSILLKVYSLINVSDKNSPLYILYQQSDLKYYADFLKNPENATKTTKKSSDDVVYYSNNPTTDEDNNIIWSEATLENTTLGYVPYPNPVEKNGEIKIQLGNNELPWNNGQLFDTYEIVSMTGQLVRKDSFSTNMWTDNELKITLENIAKWMYVIQLRNSQNNNISLDTLKGANGAPIKAQKFVII